MGHYFHMNVRKRNSNKNGNDRDIGMICQNENRNGNQITKNKISDFKQQLNFYYLFSEFVSCCCSVTPRVFSPFKIDK